MNFDGVPGVSIAIINEFAVASVEVYGVKDVARQEPVTPQTLFQAASISKSVTALAALKLVQTGRMNLDSNINQALTTWKLTENTFTRNAKVTLKRLLSHTGGTTVSGFRGYRYSENRPTLIQILNGTPPANSAPIVVDVVPGTLSRYSGGGYCVVQQSMMDVEQKAFPQILQETVLAPLAMQSSTFEQPLPSSRLAMAATGYNENGSPVPGNHHIYPELAAAGLWATPSDLAAFLVEIQKSLQGNSNGVLNREMVERMLTPPLGDSYGLGFALTKTRGEDYFGHGGANQGFRCTMLAHRTAGVGVVIMTNSENGGKLLGKIVDLTAERGRWPGYR
jgi:CubicO group peptidase (beta-lactamase class C family)